MKRTLLLWVLGMAVMIMILPHRMQAQEVYASVDTVVDLDTFEIHGQATKLPTYDVQYYYDAYLASTLIMDDWSQLDMHVIGPTMSSVNVDGYGQEGHFYKVWGLPDLQVYFQYECGNDDYYDFWDWQDNDINAEDDFTFYSLGPEVCIAMADIPLGGIFGTVSLGSSTSCYQKTGYWLDGTIFTLIQPCDVHCKDTQKLALGFDWQMYMTLHTPWAKVRGLYFCVPLFAPGDESPYPTCVCTETPLGW